MKPLEEIKNYVAYESGYDSTENITSWDTLLNEVQGDVDLINHYVGCVAILYAEQALDQASDKAKVTIKYHKPIVDKKSILEIKNQLK